MKKQLFILFLLITAASFGQSVKPTLTSQNIVDKSEKKLAFKGGEWLRFRMSYSNFINAGSSTIAVNEIQENGQKAFHIKGEGQSSWALGLFFKVDDDYQTFMYKESLKPYRFIRKIDEGGYTKDQEIFFDYTKNEATVKNYKHKTETKHPITSDIQDILSSLYFLRNQDLNNLKVGQEIKIQMFFDDEINNFKMHFLGKEVIKTKFGKINALAFRPMVQAGRVFKEQESLTVWVSDDLNKIPLKIKADLAIGSLRADLDAFKGLAHPFNIIFDN